MASFELVRHPDSPPLGISAVSVQLSPLAGQPGEYFIEYCIAHSGSLFLPQMLTPTRAADLWKTTCCELFVAQVGSTGYVEFNLSPSTQWAAYQFDGYRERMRVLDLAFDPEIEITPGLPGYFWLACALDMSVADGEGTKVNFAAVIEETCGTKSYWALAHGAGPPDFHNRDCWTATLSGPNSS